MQPAEAVAPEPPEHVLVQPNRRGYRGDLCSRFTAIVHRQHGQIDGEGRPVVARDVAEALPVHFDEDDRRLGCRIVVARADRDDLRGDPQRPGRRRRGEERAHGDVSLVCRLARLGRRSGTDEPAPRRHACTSSPHRHVDAVAVAPRADLACLDAEQVETARLGGNAVESAVEGVAVDGRESTSLFSELPQALERSPDRSHARGRHDGAVHGAVPCVRVPLDEAVLGCHQAARVDGVEHDVGCAQALDSGAHGIEHITRVKCAHIVDVVVHAFREQDDAEGTSLESTSPRFAAVRRDGLPEAVDVPNGSLPSRLASRRGAERSVHAAFA